MKSLFKYFFCRAGKHNWEYYTAGNQLVNIEGDVGFADIPMRQCKNCERVEQKLTGEYEYLEGGK